MMRLRAAGRVVFLIAVASTMAGRGGGNFYVPALAAAALMVVNAGSSG
jgi:hypothetical protein